MYPLLNFVFTVKTYVFNSILSNPISSNYSEHKNIAVFANRWEGKLPDSKSALESTWLYHEIGRCHLELGHHTDALEYGYKSLDSAVIANDDVWNLNAHVLIAQSQGELEVLIRHCRCRIVIILWKERT